MHKREQVFLETIADKNKTYIYEPVVFIFSNGEKYKPDFYCVEDNQFIEIAGSVGAFWIGKFKYRKMEEENPDINFKIIFVGMKPLGLYTSKRPQKNIKSKCFQLRLSELELIMLKQLASSEDLTASQWLRQVVDSSVV